MVWFWNNGLILLMKKVWHIFFRYIAFFHQGFARVCSKELRQFPSFERRCGEDPWLGEYFSKASGNSFQTSSCYSAGRKSATRFVVEFVDSGHCTCVFLSEATKILKTWIPMVSKLGFWWILGNLGAKTNTKVLKENTVHKWICIVQDFTGVPAVVDLAAMRDAIKRLGGDANKINPLVRSGLK